MRSKHLYSTSHEIKAYELGIYRYDCGQDSYREACDNCLIVYSEKKKSE